MHPLPISENDFEKINAWNGTIHLANNTRVDEIIQRQNQAQPGSLAIASWDGSLTYSQLDDLSARLSIVLAEHGVKPQGFVPLCFEKSLWAIVAVLAVIKAGGAFVFLDPSFPNVRLRQICQDVGSQLVVCSKKQTGLARSLSSEILTVGPSSDWAKSAFQENQTTNARPTSHTPGDPLYAVFTSGTTGGPKGIVVEHKSFVTSMSALSPLIGLGPGTRLLQSAAYLWDTSVLEILAPLMAGACVCIPSQDQLHSGCEGVFRDFQITHAGLTPTVARTIRPENVPDLDTLVLWGEQMTHTDVVQWHWRGKVRLMNGYGPAECSVVATIQCDSSVLVDNPSNFGTGTAAITWVVDPENHDRLMPIGEAGELILEGPIVGRGYLNDVAATKEAFIDPPWWRSFFRGPVLHPLYKTGDLVRYSKEGSLEFVGRKDHQVKLRGQRVDLTAVEQLLRQTSATVRDVVVEPVTLSSNNIQLAAFVLHGRQDDCGKEFLIALPDSEFHAWVRSAVEDLVQLPHYMVPASFFRVTAIPRTLSNKVDRRKLRALAAQLSIADLRELGVLPAIVNAPKSAAELTLRDVVADVLGLAIQDVGLDDTFSGLGGDSIAAMQVVSLCREAGIVFSVDDVTRCKTLGQIAENRTEPHSADPHSCIRRKAQWVNEPVSTDGSRPLFRACRGLSSLMSLCGTLLDVILRVRLFIWLLAVAYLVTALLDLE